MTRDSADTYIRAHYGTTTSLSIAAALGSGWTGPRVRVRAQRLGIAQRRSTHVAGRSERASVAKRAAPLPQHHWTELQRRQLEELREMGEPYTVIAREIGIAPIHVKREIGHRAEPQQPPAPPARPIAEVRRELEGRLHEHALASNGIRCVCGRPGSPIHCDRHANLFREGIST